MKRATGTSQLSRNCERLATKSRSASLWISSRTIVRFLNLLDADYTFVNEALAKHYGITGVAGSEWQRVDGIPKFGRGGILGQAAVCRSSSEPHEQVQFCAAISSWRCYSAINFPARRKTFLSYRPMKLPESLSVRELTESTVQIVAAPDVTRGWTPMDIRSNASTLSGAGAPKIWLDRPIHDRATLKGGVEVEGLDGLQNYLLTNERHAFVHQFCRKLLGYSLGRAIQLSDEPLLDEMEASSNKAGIMWVLLIDMIVRSHQFREIRGRAISVKIDVEL